MHLIDALKKSSDSAHQTFLPHVFAYTGIQSRQSVSLFCRVANVNTQDLLSLKNSCLNFFRAKALFPTVTHTTWTFGHIIPAHAQDVFVKYSLGLNSNGGFNGGVGSETYCHKSIQPKYQFP